MARLYANENFPLPAVEVLRQLGHDVLTVRETGKADQSWLDDAVLAVAENRAVLTLNRRHFVRLHNASSSHAGIVVCSLDIDFDRQARRIHDAVASYSDLAGQLVRVNRPAV